MEKDVLKFTNELWNFEWNKLKELEQSNNLNAFVDKLNIHFPNAAFYILKNNLLNDINYHLYILKKYGNFDSRSRFNVNDEHYLVQLWSSFTGQLIMKDSGSTDLNLAQSNIGVSKIRSEVIINYLEWLSKKTETSMHYGDLILLFYKVQDIFLSLYVKQN